MKIGVHAPQWGDVADRDSLLTIGRTAEDAGLASIWVSDHLIYPGPYLDMFAVLGLLAGSTDTIELGTSVMVLPRRDTIPAAKQLSTLAVVAPGRLIIGAGAGWLADEFELLGRSPEQRGRMLDEQIEALRGLLRVERFSYEGEMVRFPQLEMEPRPAEVPPIWIGGNSPKALARAGRLGDAWHPVALGPAQEQGMTAEELGRKYARVRATAAESGRKDEVQLTARVGVGAAPHDLDLLRRDLEVLRQTGCAHVLVAPEYSSLADAARLCEELGELADDFRT